MTPETIVQIIATSVVAISNIILVWLTFKYVRETRHMVEEMKISREPSIFLDFEFPGVNRDYLIIENFGDSAALDITVSFENKLEWSKCLLDTIPIFTDGISYLTPGRKLMFRAGFLDWDKAKEKGGTIKFNIDYKNETGKRFERSILFDISQYVGVQFKSYKDTGDKISDSVKDLERNQDINNRFQNVPHHPLFTKACPVCGEIISNDARKCPNCLEFIDEIENNSKG